MEPFTYTPPPPSIGTTILVSLLGTVEIAVMGFLAFVVLYGAWKLFLWLRKWNP